MSSLAIRNLVPMLVCDSVPDSIKFYTEVLGFRVDSRIDTIGRSGWASLHHGPVRIMLSSHAKPWPERQGDRYRQLTLYFYPDDVAALHAAVVAKGQKPSDLVVRFYGMKEFELLDPSGHILVFGQETDETPTQIRE